jgi:tRNA threonylcarbamoyladenosine biosynthesis protein TsaE
MEIELPDVAAQLAFGARLAAQLPPQCVLYLEGDLGTGKTTLTRGILRQLGHSGAVRSPTYTLLEPYQLAQGALYHLDLYRLTDPEDLEDLGLRDLLAEPALWVIEWPELGATRLPPPDVTIQLAHQSAGRHLTLRGDSAIGAALCF